MYGHLAVWLASKGDMDVVEGKVLLQIALIPLPICRDHLLELLRFVDLL